MSVKHDHEAALRAAGCGCQADQPIGVATEFVWGARKPLTAGHPRQTLVTRGQLPTVTEDER